MKSNQQLGLIHIYTGDGKGKTTAAVGLALRAVGNDLRVNIIQFMKALVPESGEIKAIKEFASVDVKRYGGNLLGKDHPPVEVIKEDIAKGIAEALRVAGSSGCDLMVLDEINVAVSMDLANIDNVLRVIDKCRSNNIELVMTGRNAPKRFIDGADYVTEFKMLKHPFEAGIGARRGIEY